MLGGSIPPSFLHSQSTLLQINANNYSYLLQKKMFPLCSCPSPNSLVICRYLFSHLQFDTSKFAAALISRSRQNSVVSLFRSIQKSFVKSCSGFLKTDREDQNVTESEILRIEVTTISFSAAKRRTRCDEGMKIF